MSEAAIQLVESMEVDQKALTYADRAMSLPVIRTQEDYLCAGQIWKDGKDLLKAIDDGYNDLLSAAHKLHKDAVAKKARYYAPVDAAVRAVKQLMSAYDLEQERIRQAEQRRLEEIARKAEEERLLQEAIAVEEDAKRNGATKEEAQQESAAIMAEPVYIPPVILPKETPKVQGMSFRTIWKFEIVNAAYCNQIRD